MKTKLLYVVIAVVLICTLFLPAPARAAQAEGNEFERILGSIVVLVVGFAALGGFSKLTAAVISLLKLTGLVRDGTSSQWAAGINLMFFVGLVAFRVFRPDTTLELLDGYAGQIAQIAVFVLGFMVQMAGSKPTYDQLKAAGVPLLGKSLTKPGTTVDLYVKGG
jgi:hypothetical protein